MSFENLTACSVILTQQGTQPCLWNCPNIYTPNIVLTHELRVLLSLNFSLNLNLLLSFTMSLGFECLVITLSFTLSRYAQRVCALNAAARIHVVISIMVLNINSSYYTVILKLLVLPGSQTRIFQCLCLQSMFRFFIIMGIFHKTQESPHWYLPNYSGELILWRWVKMKAVVNLLAFSWVNDLGHEWNRYESIKHGVQCRDIKHLNEASRWLIDIKENTHYTTTVNGLVS